MKEIVTATLRPDESQAHAARCEVHWADASAPAAVRTGQLIMLMECLGHTRVALDPPVPSDFPGLPTSFRAIGDPKWHLHLDSAEEVILSIRHPGHGWLIFQLGPQSATGLAENLLRLTGVQSTSRPPQPH